MPLLSGTFPIVKVEPLHPVSLQVLERVQLGPPPPVIQNGHCAIIDHSQF